MDYQLNEDQNALVDSLNSILQRYRDPAQDDRLSYSYFQADLRQTLEEGGFFDAAEAMGTLEAALVAIECARIPGVVEAAASTLVAPHLVPGETLPGPIALVASRDLGKAIRNLPIAKTLIVDTGDDVVVLAVDPAGVEEVKTIFAYPYGTLTTPPDLASGRRLGAAARAKLLLWWRLALAADMAGSAQAAVAFTSDYVKERHVFGKPLGALQAVQHRLAQCYQISRAMYYLCLRAAWGADPQLADVAINYAQQHIHKLVFDLHQFNGGMGVTCEHKLHFWTYRLRALQAESGTVDDTALAIADRAWGVAG